MGGGEGLIVHDTISVASQGGDCQIQLCFGDITKLQKKDKVDVIFVSSFGGNYDQMPGTVIGALYENLGLNVRDLADDKEEDLRDLYSCWWSKPLPAKLPYHRLLCFESRRNRGGRPQELVGHAFRCLVPILKNKDASVITPLLSTGNQGYDPKVMLESMVHAAVSWIKAGLPIRLLKIVIYSVLEDGKAFFQRGVDVDILERFEELKTRYESANLVPQEVSLEYDVYLSYSKQDQEVADRIQLCLLEEKPDIRICTSHQEMDKEAVYQDQMYEVVSKSARVITVLTPNYMSSEACLEQYNIALCCNRQAHRNLLAPFFVQTVTLPTYMGLVQYADCREDQEASIARTCSQLVKALTATDKVVKVATTDPNHYDVFVSYCHADSDRANPIVSRFKELAPELKVFYDIQELKTGHEWQRTLYHSIDGTSCMIALISPSYLKSAVCMEEYSLAQTKHLSQDKLQLIPVCISEGVEKDFASISHLSMLDARPAVYDQATYSIAAAVVCWLKTGSFNHLEEALKKKQADQIDVMDLMEKVRTARFKSVYGQNLENTSFPPNCDGLRDDFEAEETSKGSAEEKEPEAEGKDGQPPEPEQPKAEDKATAAKPDDQTPGAEGTTEGEEKAESRSAKVVFSYHQTDIKFVHFLQKVLKMFAPQVAVTSESSSDQERLDCLEAADHIVALLSPSYMESPQHVEEFHMGLWRQRVSPEAAPVLLPIQVAQLPSRPTYFQLMGPPVNTWDALWAQLQGVQKVTAPQELQDIRNAIGKQKLPKLSPDELLPMAEVAQRLVAAIKTSRTIVKEDPPKVRPALINTVKLQREISTLSKETHKELQEYLVKVPEMPESKQGSKSCTIS